MAKFQCPKCSRSFSMAAHLGRHVKASHGAGRKKSSGRRAKSAKRRGPGRPPGRPPGRRTASASSDFSAARVIRGMVAYRNSLVSQRDSLDAKISSIDNALLEMGAPSGGGRRPAGRGPGRPRKSGAGRPGRPRGAGFRAGSLKESVVKVLRQSARAMSPREIASAVKASGYKTKASDLTKAVSNALPNLKMVKRARRGFYKISGR